LGKIGGWLFEVTDSGIIYNLLKIGLIKNINDYDFFRENNFFENPNFFKRKIT
jgi:hypothetical protein